MPEYAKASTMMNVNQWRKLVKRVGYTVMQFQNTFIHPLPSGYRSTDTRNPDKFLDKFYDPKRT